MLPGISSYTYTWECGVPGHDPPRPLDGLALCHRALTAGLPVVQLCENIRFPRSDWTAARDLGLAIEIGTRGLLGSHLAEALEAAAFFRSPIVRLVIDRDGHEPGVAEAVELLRPWVSRARDAGIRLAIENHDRFPAQTLADLVADVDPEWVGVTLDTVNSFGALEGPEVVVRTLAPLTLCLHLKDFTIRRVPSQLGFVIEGCPLGEGRLDTRWLLAELARAGRSPNAILELWTPPAATLDETLTREAEWAEKSVTALRALVSTPESPPAPPPS